MRKFIIYYNKIGDINNLKMEVTVSKPTGDIGHDAQAALNLFIASKGSLHKNNVFEIQEIDEIGNKIGEPIRPISQESSIVPVRKIK